ncbi:hypothetical protein D8674_009291 [Pyrus ussuriensis x Pyrus communis]|uniref:RNase H type-1 domain-containing protein n=1 Tax=Pyrus ussuriensis x Pyrus communis TaxID=2448454 RepID=A0A5N5I054_9ROSA|nr:hypothetical protein D8674_009291 [Pyrus ussuriensis x Pyrus communis]
MLAKVGWQLICNPDSSLARVLQAKYYHSSSFMDAPTGISGVGWVARDFVGIFNGAGAKAMRATLVACVEKGFTSIQLETDSQVLIDMIHGCIQPEAVLDVVVSYPIINQNQI